MTGVDIASLATNINKGLNGDPALLIEAAAQLNDTALKAVSSQNRSSIAVLRAQVDRLRRRLQRHQDGTPLAATFLASLVQLDARLAAALVALDTRVVADEQQRAAKAVPERLYRLLGAPRRPGDLVRKLELDPSQVSRGLRTLLEARKIVQVEAPVGSDGRGRWYQAAATKPAQRAHTARQLTAHANHASATLTLTAGDGAADF